MRRRVRAVFPAWSSMLELTEREKSDKLSDMKTFSSRDFQKNFGHITDSLKNGQTVEVTKHGKPVGRFTKTDGKRREMPDFLSWLEKFGGSKEVGNQILKEFNDSLS